MTRVKLRDLNKGDYVQLFRGFDSAKKFTVEYADVREHQNKEVVDMKLVADDGEVRRFSFLSADSTILLWTEELRQQSIEKELESIAKDIDEVAGRIVDSEFHEYLYQAMKSVMRAKKRTKELELCKENVQC